MIEYVRSIVFVASCGGLATLICPDGDGGKLKKIFSFLMTALMIIAIANPLRDLIGMINNFNASGYIDKIESENKKSYTDAWQSTIVGITEDEVKKYIDEILIGDYNLSSEQFSTEIKISFKEETPMLDAIKITLKGLGILKNPRSIEERIETDIGCECIVYSDLEG